MIEKILPGPNATARELLETVAGKDHGAHSVAKKDDDLRTGVVTMTCSCGASFNVAASADVRRALRNVGG